MEVLCLL